jgi:hypothetical protein
MRAGRFGRCRPAFLPGGRRVTDTPTERASENRGTGLRRRKLVQWALAYAAGAWGLLQVLGFAADAFGWPGLVKQLAMLGLAVGLPIILTLAWFHGERAQQRVTGQELAILTLLLLIGGGLLWWYANRPADAPHSMRASSDGWSVIVRALLRRVLTERR